MRTEKIELKFLFEDNWLDFSYCKEERSERRGRGERTYMDYYVDFSDEDSGILITDRLLVTQDYGANTLIVHSNIELAIGLAMALAIELYEIRNPEEVEEG